MQLIKLSNSNKSFIVDDIDFSQVKLLTWTHGNGNIFTWYLGESISIGKYILKILCKINN